MVAWILAQTEKGRSAERPEIAVVISRRDRRRHLRPHRSRNYRHQIPRRQAFRSQH